MQAGWEEKLYRNLLLTQMHGQAFQFPLMCLLMWHMGVADVLSARADLPPRVKRDRLQRLGACRHGVDQVPPFSPPAVEGATP